MNPFVVRFLTLLTDFIPLDTIALIQWDVKQEARVRHVQGVLPSPEGARPLEVLRSFCSLGTSVMAETKTSN